MKIFLLLTLPVLLIVGCEDNETKENYTVHDLPTKFPLDKDYAWEFEHKEYSTKTLWENETLPDTSFLDTLYIGQTQNDYCYYWWGNNPSGFSLVKNKNDVNHFIRTNYYYIEEDSTTDWEKPNLWADFSSIFDTTGYNATYYSFRHNRTTEIDTFENVITHSYISYTAEPRGIYDYYSEAKYNLFGSEQFKYYRDYYDEGITDIFYIKNKLREINVATTNMSAVSLEFDTKLERGKKLANKAKVHKIDFEDKLYDDEIW